MLMLPGPVKIDLLFLDQPHTLEPPWTVNGETLPRIDDHFWDWALWLAARDAAGKTELVREELRKMSAYLLRPLGVERVPEGVDEAISTYIAARDGRASELGVAVSPALEDEARRALSRAGYGV